jgi:prepilin-type N-terminal cleavage/methylation domain-containing protein
MHVPALTSPAAVQSPLAPNRRRAFTLVEVLVATTILGMAAGMTMVVFIASLKRAQHTELMLKGTAELRYAADFVSQAVRSSAQLPTIAASGLQLIVPPKDLGVLVVENGDWIDQPHGVKGFKSNQRLLKVKAQIPAVVNSVFASTTRPPGVLSATDVGTYFVDATKIQALQVDSLVQAGDLLDIPATAYGPAINDWVVNSVSHNAGIATITFTNALMVDVPDETKINASSGRRAMFEVIATGKFTGDLRYYPSKDNTSNFVVLAHDIDPTPLSDPSIATSTATVPFVIPSTSADYVIINLQKVPKGTMVGRTLQGVQTTAFTRSDPTIP